MWYIQPLSTADATVETSLIYWRLRTAKTTWCRYVLVNSIGAIPDTGTNEILVFAPFLMAWPSCAKRFLHQQYTENRHCSTGTRGISPLHHHVSRVSQSSLDCRSNAYPTRAAWAAWRNRCCNRHLSRHVFPLKPQSGVPKQWYPPTFLDTIYCTWLYCWVGSAVYKDYIRWGGVLAAGGLVLEEVKKFPTSWKQLWI